jgi:hypothetical protein
LIDETFLSFLAMLKPELTYRSTSMLDVLHSYNTAGSL